MHGCGCYILAGGQSSRMGENKAFVCVGEKAMIERQLAILTLIFKNIVIVANDHEQYDYLNLPVIPDLVPGFGPLGGIYTALQHSSTAKNFIMACDMPFPEENLIRWLVHCSEDYDITVIRDREFYEPLFAVYDRNCIQAIAGSIEKGKKKITGFYDKCDLKIKELALSEIRAIDEKVISLFNVNTKHDLEKANCQVIDS